MGDGQVAQPIFTVRYTLLLTAILAASWGGVQGVQWLSKPEMENTVVLESPSSPPINLPPISKHSADDKVDQALQYSLEGKYFDAANILIPLARQGFSRAQLYLAVAYYHGHGVSRDRQKAKQMFFILRDKNYEPGIVNTYLNLLGSLPPA